MKTLFFVFFSISIAVAQSADSTDRNIPKGYWISYVNDSVDYLVIGKEGNQLFGSPRNDGSEVAMMADLSYLRNNGAELTWVFDRSISYGSRAL